MVRQTVDGKMLMANIHNQFLHEIENIRAGILGFETDDVESDMIISTPPFIYECALSIYFEIVHKDGVYAANLCVNGYSLGAISYDPKDSSLRHVRDQKDAIKNKMDIFSKILVSYVENIYGSK